MQKSIEVALNATLKQTDSQQQHSVEIVGLSASGAIIQSTFAPGVGERIALNLQGENLNGLYAKVESYLDWNNSQKMFSLSFDDLSNAQSQTIRLIIDYYSRLKRAGVQLDSPLKEGTAKS